ncbi:hypothetical protein GF325_03640 [Candidatus Bathyarchaeota archaeon]|nr:hypothetical protein [Candidatus Bathyarchaeota archaeon]
METEVYLNLGIMILFSVLLVLFIYQVVKQDRSAPFFIVSLACGVAGGLFAFLDSMRDEISVPLNHSILLALQISFYGLQFMFFYLFLESLVTTRINPWRLTIAIMFFTIQVLSLWLIVWFQGNPVTNDLWLFADIGYSNLALFTFVIFGLFIYIRMYKYTKEVKPIIFAVALIIVGGGFVIISLTDYIGYWGSIPSWLSEISILGDALPLAGLAIFTITYLSDVSYIYRLPFDVYALMVTTNAGVSIHSVALENTRRIKIEEQMLSGFLSAINELFRNFMGTKFPVDHITSPEASILIEQGSIINIVIVASKDSTVLERGMKRYCKEFEHQFGHRIRSDLIDMSEFEDAKRLIRPIFPFLKVRKLET